MEAKFITFEYVETLISRKVDLTFILSKEYDIVTVINTYTDKVYGYCGGKLIAYLKDIVTASKKTNLIEIYRKEN